MSKMKHRKIHVELGIIFLRLLRMHVRLTCRLWKCRHLLYESNDFSFSAVGCSNGNSNDLCRASSADRSRFRALDLCFPMLCWILFVTCRTLLSSYTVSNFIQHLMNFIHHP